MSDSDQPTIDQRIAAIALNVERITLDIRAMQEKQERLDARERKARQAILGGIAAYLEALEEDDAEG